MIDAICRGARATVLIVLLAAIANCGFTTGPSEMLLTGNWLGHVSLIDGGLAWQLWLEEDGEGNVSGTVSRTDFRRIPHPSETISPGTVSGAQAFSDILLTLDYGTSSEVYEGRFRSEDHIQGLIRRGTVVQNIGALEFRRIGPGPEADPDGATIPPNTGITSGD
ncbi:hypothetical protein [Candidatus Palauibacter sp.]|uniref:hypothetical protein n=1 Tax=Candidatus Palauibacter sp. TaxID=3101350 RepID=UPI003AF2D8FB